MKKYMQTSMERYKKQKGLYRKTGTAPSEILQKSNYSLSDVRKALHS
jgi:hypothetical protein